MPPFSRQCGFTITGPCTWGTAGSTATRTGQNLGPSVRLLRTPGHTAEDISTVVFTPGDVFACTHAWWGADGPADDPLGSDAGALHVSRELLLSFASVIVPGHGAAFRPDHSTPR